MLECSAKDDMNVTEIFKTLLSLSRILPANNESTMGLKRRSSAYVSATSKGKQTDSVAPLVHAPFLIYWFCLFFVHNGPHQSPLTMDPISH